MVIVRKNNMVTVQPKHAPAAPAPPRWRSRVVLRRIAAVVLPWFAARSLFKPKVGALRKDRMLDRLSFWRAALGLAVIALATFPYPRYWSEIPFNTYLKATKTGGYALLLLPPAFLVMLIVTRSGHRVRLMRGALRTLGYAVLALAAFYLPIVWFLRDDLSRLFVDGTHEFNPLPSFLSGRLGAAEVLFVVFLVVFLGPWYLGFWYCTIYWAARTGFWIGALHPLLTPIATTSVMLLITTKEIIKPETNDVPHPLWLALTLCGAASSLLLAVFEYQHLRSTGHRFRSGPEPMTTDETEADALTGPVVPGRGPEPHPR
ncbi:hypothetical protein [Saccharopolyspora kobensis]